ncbi:MAG: hypothetical protein K1060chlam1_01042 [Candidatus Anoxychlamydiales bacterium]|nr:hypothetical protein [Candidatus Anoxychlamydiales bacterium]
MSAASEPRISLGSSPSRPRPAPEKKETSVFLVAESVIRSNAKNVLKTIRQSFEWLRLTFENLKDSIPVGNVIKFTKIGESTFAFGDLARSTLRIGHNVKSFVKEGISKTITSFAENTLDLIWNVLKIFKALKNPIFPIFTLASKFFVPLQTIGGASFALSSANRIFKQVKGSSKLLDDIAKHPTDIKTCQKNDLMVFARILDTAKNICTFIIGTMISIGFVASGTVILSLGTIILISEISLSTLNIKIRQLEVEIGKGV